MNRVSRHPKQAIVLRLFASLLLALSMWSCAGADVQEGSRTTDEAGAVSRPATCDCRDLECWRHATRDGVVAQLSCVNSALGAAANLASAGTIAAAQTGAGALELARAFEKRITFAADATVIMASGTAVGLTDGKASTILDLIKAIGTGNGDLLKQAFGADYTKSPKLNCFKAANDVVKGIVDISGNVVKATEKLPDDITGLVPVLKAFVSTAETLTNGLMIFDNCAAAFTGPQEEVGRTLKAVSNGMKKVLAQVKTVFAFVDCGVGFYRGGRVLINNTACLMDDLQALAASRQRVASALAYTGSRQFNHAKYIGCTNCVNSSTWTSAETEYNRCRSCCESRGMDHIGAQKPKTLANWVSSCQLTCGVARTEGIVYNYTDHATCNEVRNINPVSRTFRLLDLAYANAQDRRRSVSEERARVQRHLETVKANFAYFDAAGGAAADGLIAVVDFTAAAARRDNRPEILEAARFFGLSYVDQRGPYYFRLVDGAGSEGATDGLIGATDIDHFRDEVSEFRDESEFD